MVTNGHRSKRVYFRFQERIDAGLINYYVRRYMVLMHSNTVFTEVKIYI